MSFDKNLSRLILFYSKNIDKITYAENGNKMRDCKSRTRTIRKAQDFPKVVEQVDADWPSRLYKK